MWLLNVVSVTAAEGCAGGKGGTLFQREEQDYGCRSEGESDEPAADEGAPASADEGDYEDEEGSKEEF